MNRAEIKAMERRHEATVKGIEALMDIGAVIKVYEGSDGEATKALYTRLEQCGDGGRIAMNLFRAQKASSRAKVYRGGNANGRYRDQAYARKQWSLDQLCETLLHVYSKEALVAFWGWQIDESQEYHRFVLYLDLFCGQVSFHSATRGKGPDYPGRWDGKRNVCPQRICHFVAFVLAREAYHNGKA